MIRFKRLVIISIVSVACARIMLIFHGYPEGWHPDEWRIVLETLSMAQNHSLIPANINYPLFFKYILMLFYGLWYLVGRLFSFFSSPWDFAMLFFKTPEIFLIIPRVINSFIGLFIVFIGYKVAKIIFDKKVAIVAAVFLLVEYQLLAHSVYGLHQISAALSTLPVFYYAYQFLYNQHKLISIALGIAFGVAISVHQTNILFIFPLTYLFISQFYFQRKLNFTNIILFTLVSIPISLLGNLYWIFDFHKSLSFFSLGNEVSKIAFSSHQVFNYNIPSFITWFVQEIVKQDIFLGVFMIFGIIFAIIRRKREDWFFLLYFISYVVFFYSWAFRWLHLLIGIIPIICIYGAKTASMLLGCLSNNKYIKQLIVLSFFISTIYSLKGLFLINFKPDTRLVAKNWVQKNIDNNQKIAIDWSAYNIILPSEIPVFLRNPVGREYFEKNIPLSIKQSLDSNSNYSIIEAMYNSSVPIWPTYMPTDKIDKAKKTSIFNNLYSYYNFIDISQLVNQADYLIISSYSYSMFLFDSDTRKINMFNPYIKDDIIKYQSHVEGSVENSNHGMVSYVAERGRKFYLPILNQEDSRIKEIKRFEPDSYLSGPTIIIYQIIR